MSPASNTPDLKTTAGKISDLTTRLAETIAPVGEKSLDIVHSRGELSARERVEHLLDAGSFIEVDALARHRSTNFGADAKRPVTDGVVTGYGTVDGRKVCVYSEDPTVFDGRVGEVYGDKIVKIQQLALKTGVPLIGIHAGAGSRFAEGVAALAAYSQILYNNSLASGVIPLISVVAGPLEEEHTLLPSLADITVAVDAATMTLTVGDQADEDSYRLDEAGTVHHTAATDAQALDWVKKLLSYLPANNRAEAPRRPLDVMTGSIEDNITDDDKALDTVIPDDPSGGYDMTQVINAVVEADTFFEVSSRFAPSMITGFARVEGRAVGVVANQPQINGGRVTGPAAEKAARFIRTCDCFNIPLIVFVDAPGFSGDNQGTAVRSIAKLIFAYSEATVGKITVVTRFALGGAYCVMGSKRMGADICLGWPTATIAIGSAGKAVDALYEDKLAKAASSGKDVDSLRQGYIEDYEKSILGPYKAAERGLLDSVIMPSRTRGQIIEALRLLDRKVVNLPDKKHGNIPL